jgi:hypothetical protein
MSLDIFVGVTRRFLCVSIFSATRKTESFCCLRHQTALGQERRSSKRSRDQVVGGNDLEHCGRPVPPLGCECSE